VKLEIAPPGRLSSANAFVTRGPGTKRARRISLTGPVMGAPRVGGFQEISPGPAGARDSSAHGISGRLDARRSSLGRHGHDPRRVVAVLVYASLGRNHESSKVARAVDTGRKRFRLLVRATSIAAGHVAPASARTFTNFFASAIEHRCRDGLRSAGSLRLARKRLIASGRAHACRRICAHTPVGLHGAWRSSRTSISRH